MLAITITPGPGQITIARIVELHYIIRVFRPDWSTAFQCVDCAVPQTITGLDPGNHYVEVKLVNAGWGEICTESQTIEVFGGGSTPLKILNDRQRLAFDNIRPNPAQYFIEMDLYSQETQSAVLDFYDVTGRPVHRMETELKAGRNILQVDVSEWKSGSYHVIGRGDGLPAYGRFF